ncbi:MAG: DUF1674 domain-containing protein [Steroidobacteraceae bacterium]
MQDDSKNAQPPPATPADASSGRQASTAPEPPQSVPRERGGPAGLEPTRYGDWERNGRCIDF